MNPINGFNFPTNLANFGDIAKLGELTNLSDLTKPAGNEQSFKNFMLEAIQQVNGMQQDADRAVEQLMTGGDVNMAEVLTTVQKADMSFRMMLQIRNKLVQAYQEIKDIRI